MDQLMWVACLAADGVRIELPAAQGRRPELEAQHLVLRRTHPRDEVDHRQSVAVGDTERDDLLSARARGRLDELEHTRTR